MGSLSQDQEHDVDVSFQGFWRNNEFYIKTATNEDYQKIISHLRQTYYKEEPCHKLLGWCEKKAQDLDLVVLHILDHGLSLIAIHLPTNQVAGVRIVIDQRRKLDFTKLPLQSPHIPMIFKAKNKLLDYEHEQEQQMKMQMNPTNKFEFATGFIASVQPEFRGIGLASEMHVRSLEHVRESGLTLMKSFFSSPVTIKIAKQLGYVEVAHLYLGDLRDENGQLYFVNAKPPPEHLISYMKLHLS